MSATDVAIPTPPLFDEARLAIAGFLARYSGPTRIAYTTDLRQYFAWCADQDLDVFAARRGHLELWARSMEERGLARATVGRRLSISGFYRFAVVDGLLAHSPAEFIRRPKISTESATLGLDRMELGAFIACGAAGSPTDHALACLLGLLGLRVSEACSIDVEDLGAERGHRIVTVLGKGAKLAVIPLPPRIARALDLAASERRSGPLLLARSGNRLNRHAAVAVLIEVDSASEPDSDGKLSRFEMKAQQRMLPSNPFHAVDGATGLDDRIVLGPGFEMPDHGDPAGGVLILEKRSDPSLVA